MAALICECDGAARICCSRLLCAFVRPGAGLGVGIRSPFAGLAATLPAAPAAAAAAEVGALTA